ncbi:MAG: prolipoprotein diacylglyceryl transferase [Dehalococcoidia bacterium]|nr:prolipoprotein diacylglyceryl transferase [Dehalococcoidia bacterium]
MDILAVLSIPFDPDIIRTAGFILSWHGFFTFVAVAVAVYLTWRWGRREGLDGDAILSVSTWCIIGGIIGARILHVVDFWDDVYQYDPMRILYFWNGGIAIFGAYLGGFAGGAVYITMRNAPSLHRACDNAALRWTGMHRPFPQMPSVAHLADVAAPALLIALAVGRIGDVINGEHWSSFSDLPWAWVYTDPDSLGYGRPASHPAVAYELIFCLIWAGVLWWLKDRIIPRGMLFALFFAGYSAGRFFISFVRQEQNTYIFGFNEAQLVALAVMLVTVPLLIYRARLVRRPARRRGAVAAAETEEA